MPPKNQEPDPESQEPVRSDATPADVPSQVAISQVAAKEYAEAIVGTMPIALVVLETNLRVRSASQTFYDTFQVTLEETEGQLIYDLGNGQWNIPELRTLLEEILPNNEVFTDYEVEHTFEEIGQPSVHFGEALVVQQQRQTVMLAAYAAHPNRFVRGEPFAKGTPAAVWINPPLASADLS